MTKNSKYLKWVKEQPSCVSGNYGVDCHHIKGRGYGQKKNDLFTIPLTRQEHTEFHHFGWKTWEDKYNIDQRDAVLDTIARAIKEGIIVIR